METMYERIKRMSESEMKQFVYWVYLCGNEDAKENLCDSHDDSTYFGGYMLTKEAKKVMPNDTTDDLWAMFNEMYGMGFAQIHKRSNGNDEF